MRSWSPGSIDAVRPVSACVRCVPRSVRVTSSTDTSVAAIDSGSSSGRTSSAGMSRGAGVAMPGIQTPAGGGPSRKARTVPSLTTVPSAESTTTRSTWSSHGSMRCSTISSVRPSAADRIASRTPAEVSVSSIDVGSSSSSRSGRIASTPARASRCCSPPERAALKCSRPYARPTDASASSTRDQISSRAIPAFSGPNATSRPIRSATIASAGFCRSSPSRPSTSAVPLSSPAIVVPSAPARPYSSVDLPAPLGPTSSTRSPGSIVRSSPATTGLRRPRGRHVKPLKRAPPRAT